MTIRNVVQLQSLYDSWIEADRAWMDAIERAYPKQWPGDVRYTTKGKGEPDTALRAAHDKFAAARDAFHAAGGSDWLSGSGDRWVRRCPHCGSHDRVAVPGGRCEGCIGRATDADIQDRERDNLVNRGSC